MPFSKHSEGNISDFTNLINASDQSSRFSFLKDISLTNNKNYHFNAQKTRGYQIWTIDTSVVDQLETYSVVTDGVILPFLLLLRKGYGYQIQTPGLVSNVIDNLIQSISISNIKPFSCFNSFISSRLRRCQEHYVPPLCLHLDFSAEVFLSKLDSIKFTFESNLYSYSYSKTNKNQLGRRPG